jgi:glycosyl transferase, family 25
MSKLFVINLDADSERMANLAKRLEEMSIDYERVSAFNGRNKSKEDLNNYFFNHHQIYLPHEQGGAQVGCFLSHFSVWERVANGDDDFSFIFEDDIYFSPDIKKFIDSDEWLPNKFDLIRLEVSTNRLLLSEVKKTSFYGRKIHQLNSTSWCAGAYVISKDCARRLISFQLDKFISADAFLFCFEISKIAKHLNLYQISPALAIQDKFKLDQDKVGYESNIETDSYLYRLWWSVKTFINTFSIIAFIKKAVLGYKRVVFK